MKRAFIVALLGVAALVGVFRLELVAQEAEESEAESQAAEVDEFQQWQQHTDGFAGRLVVGDDLLLQEFRDSLQSQPGQIVLHDRADRASAEVVEEAQANVIPNWFGDHFAESDGRFQPRPEDAEFNSRLVTVAQTVDEDLAVIGDVFRRVAPRVRQESEIERLIAHFLNSDAAAVMIYMQELQRVLRPDLNLLLEATDGVFVRRGDGRLGIHPGRREDATRYLEIVRSVTEGMPLIEEELQDWSREMATPDDFHRQVQDALGDPHFAAFIVLEALEGEGARRPITQRVEGFFQQLEELTVDTADGLLVRDEYQDELQHGLDEFQRVKRALESLNGPLDEMAELLVTDDDLHREWQEILRSTPVRMRFAAQTGAGGAEPAMVAEAILGEILTEADDGQLQLSHENPEEVQEFVQNMFAEYRTLRRRWRLLDTFARRVDDEEIAAALQTTGGRLFVTRDLQRQLQQLSADGLAMWVAEHFSETPEGLALNPESREAIEDFMADVEGLIRELENDDFTRDDREDDGRERNVDGAGERG